MSRRPKRAADQALQHSVAAAWLETQSSPNTRAAYRTDLETFGRWCADHGSIPIRADAAALAAFQAARQAAGDSPSTLRRRWSALSSFYDFAVDHDVTEANPAVGVSRPKLTTGDPTPTAPLSAQTVDGY